MLALREVKLSEIAKERREKQQADVITVIVEANNYGGTWIYLDEDNHYEDREKYNANVKMLLSEDGTVFTASFRGQEMKSTRTVGRSYGLEQKIRAYHGCGTKIIIDEDNVVTSVGDY